MNETVEPLLLRITEVGALLGISRSAVYREIEAGRLLTVVINQRSKRVPRAEVARYIESRVKESADK
jgi:excisionase family DNA binding protein